MASPNSALLWSATTTPKISVMAKQAGTSSPAKDVLHQLQVVSIVAAVACQRIVTTVQPHVTALHAILARPNVQASIHKRLSVLQALHSRIEAINAPGYTPYFERLGYSAFEARLQVGIVRYFAIKFYTEYQHKRVALAAFHDLAKRPRWHPALRRQVEQLRDHCWDADFLDEGCHRAGCLALKDELLDLLRGTRDGDFSCGPRLITVAAQIAPHVPSSRGRSVRFETVLHRVFLDWSAHAGGREGYTYAVDQEDFTDEATAATRKELNRPSFSPVAARYAERQQRARKARQRARLCGLFRVPPTPPEFMS